MSSTLVLADIACWAGTARVSNFIIITSGKPAAPVFVYHHLPVYHEGARFAALYVGIIMAASDFSCK